MRHSLRLSARTAKWGVSSSDGISELEKHLSVWDSLVDSAQTGIEVSTDDYVQSVAQTLHSVSSAWNSVNQIWRNQLDHCRSNLATERDFIVDRVTELRKFEDQDSESHETMERSTSEELLEELEGLNYKREARFMDLLQRDLNKVNSYLQSRGLKGIILPLKAPAKVPATALKP
jgi:hypothetical protein